MDIKKAVLLHNTQAMLPNIQIHNFVCQLFFAFMFLSIPSSTLWYFQLILSLSNDISENPGPQFTNTWGGVGGLPYFSFCNWNLNTLSNDEFSRVSLLNAHNSIHKYDIISLCETSLSVNEVVPANILPGYHYHACNHPSGDKKGYIEIQSIKQKVLNFRTF